MRRASRSSAGWVGVQEIRVFEDITIRHCCHPLPDIDPLVDIISCLIGIPETVGVGFPFVLTVVDAKHGALNHPPDIFIHRWIRFFDREGYEAQKNSQDLPDESPGSILTFFSDQMAMGVVGQFMAQDDGQFIIGAAEIEEFSGDHDLARGCEGIVFRSGAAGYYHKAVFCRQVNGVKSNLFF